MTNKQIEHLISNWENARLDHIACIPSGDKLVEAIIHLTNELAVLYTEFHKRSYQQWVEKE